MTAQVPQERPHDAARRIVVIVDPDGRERGQFWQQEIELYNDSGLAAERSAELVRIVRLADDIGRPPREYAGQFLINLLPDTDLLVMNWDVLNGDPSFGADLSLAWLEHYQYVIRGWVEDGGILVIEGQANQSIPTQRSYDALLGRSELRVSGAEDPISAKDQDDKRCGFACACTRAARRSAVFRHVRSHTIAVEQGAESKERGYEAHFPGPKARIRADHTIGPWPKLWRGWFIRPLFARSRLPWAPVMRTVDRHPTQQTTMVVAPLGDGAIFASTMYLALGQKNPVLLDVLIRAHRNTSQLPRRHGLVGFVKAHSSPLLVLLAAVLLLGAWPQLLGGRKPPTWVSYTGSTLLFFAILLLSYTQKSVATWLRKIFGR